MKKMNTRCGANKYIDNLLNNSEAVALRVAAFGSRVKC